MAKHYAFKLKKIETNRCSKVIFIFLQLKLIKVKVIIILKSINYVKIFRFYLNMIL